MSLTIDGVEYCSATEVQETLGVSRATLWRHGGKIPLGHRLRDNRVIFTREELDPIREYALRVEPIATVASRAGAVPRAPRR